MTIFIPGTYRMIALKVEEALARLEDGSLAEALSASFDAFVESKRLWGLTRLWGLKPRGVAHRTVQKIGALHQAIRACHDNPKALPKAQKALARAQEALDALGEALRQRGLLD